ncbi:hypothetical protein [Fusobacterium necrogenes]|uniref:hypothetical protein n=1 Tax=Fusobacterium necrogenes TaxID=858 RepID=UPI00255D01E3|nr:hypothetical protein [Fusobacterium necrogenes]
MSKKKIFFILFPLIVGIGIYFLYRSRTLFYFKIFEIHPIIYHYVVKLRDLAWSYRKHLPLWSVYSLPDGLWLFSFGAALLIDRLFYFFHLILFTIIFILMIFLEFVQKYFGGHGTLLGTFDILDILFFTLGYLSILLISNFFYIQNRKNINIKNNNYLIKKKEILEDLKIIILFAILGILPSLL